MVNEKSNFKEEGKAGLAYAYDDKNVYTPATHAEKGKKYKCPICGCAVHLTRTKKGKPLFARNPGQEHTDIACITIERKKCEHSFEGLDPDRFIASLCHAQSRKRLPKPIIGSSDIDIVSPNGGMATLNEETDEFKLTKFNSLRQIAESGIEHLNANDVQGNHRVSEFLMTYRYAGKFFTNPTFRLGSRIVYARYMFSTSKNKAIFFTMYTKDFSVKFRVIFNLLSDFKNYRDKFGEYVASENGKTSFKKYLENQDVLIACDNWFHIDQSRCKDLCSSNKYCNTCCGMYQAMFTNRKQIYIVP